MGLGFSKPMTRDQVKREIQRAYENERDVLRAFGVKE
jgi:hypothetical protein